MKLTNIMYYYKPPRIGFAPDATSRLRYTHQLVCATVLGKTSATNTPALEAFRHGFNIQFKANDASDISNTSETSNTSGAADLERFCEVCSPRTDLKSCGT